MHLITLMAVLLLQAPTPPGKDPTTLGPAVGQSLPAFEAQDQDGRRRDFASLRGPEGLMLVFFRSADW